jgi:hypothetical protein
MLLQSSVEEKNEHEIEMIVIEVHEYNFTPVYQMAGGPGGAHQMLAPRGEGKAPLLCIHMQKTDKSPVEPDIPSEARMMMKSLQQVMPGLNNLELVSAQASIVLSPDEYDKMGRPRPHEKITVSFTYKG